MHVHTQMAARGASGRRGACRRVTPGTRGRWACATCSTLITCVPSRKTYSTIRALSSSLQPRACCMLVGRTLHSGHATKLTYLHNSRTSSRFVRLATTHTWTPQRAQFGRRRASRPAARLSHGKAHRGRGIRIAAGMALEAFKHWCTSSANLLLVPTYCVKGTVGHMVRTSLYLSPPQERSEIPVGSQ